MKRTAIFSALLVLTASVAFGQFGSNSMPSAKYMSLGGSLDLVHETMDSNGTEVANDFKGYGFNYTTFTGRSMGVYSSFSLHAVQEWERTFGDLKPFVMSDMSNVTVDSVWGMNAQLGIGKKAMVNPHLLLIVGGGMNWSQMLADFTVDSDYYTRVTAMIGAGGLAEAALSLGSGIYLSASVRAAYNFLPVLDESDFFTVEELESGYCITPAVGFGFDY